MTSPTERHLRSVESGQYLGLGPTPNPTPTLSLPGQDFIVVGRSGHRSIHRNAVATHSNSDSGSEPNLTGNLKGVLGILLFDSILIFSTTTVVSAQSLPSPPPPPPPTPPTPPTPPKPPSPSSLGEKMDDQFAPGSQVPIFLLRRLCFRASTLRNVSSTLHAAHRTPHTARRTQLTALTLIPSPKVLCHE